MIKHLLLRNWRAYEKADIKFGPGTTFVVARNGVGKTSLIEAARWAVFGEVVGDPNTAIKIGAKDAAVEVELELPDGRALNIRRTLERPRVKVVSRLEASLGDQQLSAAEVTHLLEDAWESSLLFVSRTAFLAEGFRLEKDPDLVEQLSRAYGISDLRHARDELVIPIRELSGSLKDARTQAKDRGAELKDLRAKVASIRAAEVESHQRLEAARDGLTKASDAVQMLENATNVAEQRRSWEEKMSELVAEVSDSIAKLEVANVATALEEMERNLANALEAQRRERAIVEGRLQAVEASLDQVLGAGGTCPVCRRPLEAEDRAHAEQGHRDELVELREEYERLDFSDLLEELKRTQSLSKRALAAGPPPVVPVIEGSLEPAETRQRLAEARQTFEEAVRIHQDHETRRKISEKQLAELKAELESQHELEARYRELVLLETAQTTIDSVVGEALQGYIAPLSDEIRRRWKHLFADRPDIQIEPEGTLTRLIDGEPLPFEAFSAGEQMPAKLLLRLVALAASTTAGFCWIDEPLEHLDPTTRRLTAGMLARGSVASGIRQMVVTTYEDDLARFLAQEDETTDLVYVRTHPAE